MKEQIIGGFTSYKLKKGTIKGYGLYVTTNRILGVKGGWKQIWGEVVGKKEAIDELERMKDFEVSKQELIDVRIKREKSALKRLMGWRYCLTIRTATDTHTIAVKDKEEIGKLQGLFTTSDRNQFITEPL